jgi:subfamily B ATP-binding cassette protein MsbA
VICVIEDGRVVESGTHDALLEAGGLYSKLYEIQFNTGQESAVTAP